MKTDKLPATYGRGQGGPAQIPRPVTRPDSCQWLRSPSICRVGRETTEGAPSGVGTGSEGKRLRFQVSTPPLTRPLLSLSLSAEKQGSGCGEVHRGPAWRALSSEPGSVGRENHPPRCRPICLLSPVSASALVQHIFIYSSVGREGRPLLKDFQAKRFVFSASWGAH